MEADRSTTCLGLWSTSTFSACTSLVEQVMWLSTVGEGEGEGGKGKGGEDVVVYGKGEQERKGDKD